MSVLLKAHSNICPGPNLTMGSCVHDIGGLQEEFGPIDTREWGYQLWEMQVHAVLVVLTRKGLMSTDELRRSMESLPGHREMSYYHRWAAGMIAVSIERGTFQLQVSSPQYSSTVQHLTV